MEKEEEVACEFCLADEELESDESGVTWLREDLLMDSGVGSSFLRAGASDLIETNPVEEKDKGRRWSDAGNHEITQKGTSTVKFLTNEYTGKRLQLRPSDQVQKISHPSVKFVIQVPFPSSPKWAARLFVILTDQSEGGSSTSRRTPPPSSARVTCYRGHVDPLSKGGGRGRNRNDGYQQCDQR